ncbi:MAG TPA: prepilin-type N-terminal cleavage/methylation domain-containing protein [Lysobacter sp.]
MKRRISTLRAHATRGYTLIEVIVAFALLAAALTLLLGTLSGAAKQVRGSADAGRAALHAQSLLDQAGVGDELKPGARDGEFEDGLYRWTLEVKPWADPSQPPAAMRDPSAPRLLEVAMLVEWGDGGPRQRLALRTLRMLPAGLDTGVQ